jgi:hypothetical protein
VHTLLVFLNRTDVRLWLTVFLTVTAVRITFEAAHWHAVHYCDKPVGRRLNRIFHGKDGRCNAKQR